MNIYKIPALHCHVAFQNSRAIYTYISTVFTCHSPVTSILCVAEFCGEFSGLGLLNCQLHLRSWNSLFPSTLSSLGFKVSRTRPGLSFAFPHSFSSPSLSPWHLNSAVELSSPDSFLSIFPVSVTSRFPSLNAIQALRLPQVLSADQPTLLKIGLPHLWSTYTSLWVSVRHLAFSKPNSFYPKTPECSSPRLS